MSGVPVDGATWAADTAFEVSQFYDPNHNEINAPCEGPKVIVVPRIILPSNNGNNRVYTLSFTNMIQRGYFTKFQSFWARTSVPNGQVQLQTDLGYIMQLGAVSKEYQVGPLFCGNNATITITVYGLYALNDFVDFQIFNFVSRQTFIDKNGI